MDRCEECGYTYDTPRGELATAIRGLAPRYRSFLTTDEDKLRKVPSPGVWSPLEYACHVRDLLAVQRERIELVLKEDEPTIASMRREERAVEERYNEQDPKRVAHEIAVAADALANVLDRLNDRAWNRTAVYNYPAPAVRDVLWIARHTLHEGQHHLLDIERQLAS